MLPNLLVIGAARCGTTSLHAYLDAHPEVSMSRDKELDFFVEEKNWRRGVDWYATQFPDDEARVRGESSPAYSAYPIYRGVPARIRATLGDAKLVYLVRDPIERIVSHYMHRKANWPDTPPLSAALGDPDLGPRFVYPSRYWLQLEQYLPEFGQDEILVVDGDDLRARRDATLARIFSFVGVDPGFRSRDFRVQHNPAAVRPRRAARTLVAGAERIVGPGRVRALLAHTPVAAKAPFRRRIARPSLDDRLRARLADELRDDVERLRRFSGQRFGGWSV